MKGVVFNSLQEFVEQKLGYEFWDSLINETDLPSNGIYTSTQSYADEELFALVGKAVEKTGLEPSDLIRNFGKFVFTKLYPLAPEQAKQAADLFSFLKMVDEVIHLEVKKLYDDPNLPDFECEQADNTLTMIYTSPRKLCHLSEGLILGAAEHFNQPVTIEQPLCMHRGDKQCHIEITLI